MKSILNLISFSSILVFAFVLPSVAQNTTKPVTNNNVVPNINIHPRFSGSFTSEGAGYENSFFSVEGFIPVKLTPNALTFFEGRVFWTTDNTLGGNVLLGQRFLNQVNREILGAYLGYDVRGTGNNTFNQLGFGLERLGENWDLRLNGYLPVGSTRQSVGDDFVTGTRFAGNSLVLDLQRQYEVALSGFDLEAGGKIASLGRGDLRGYGGVYFYGAPGIEDAFGVRGRLEANPNENLRLGLVLQHDPIFDTRLVFNVGLSLGGNNFTADASVPEIFRRMGNAIARNGMIAVAENRETITQPATNPQTGQPWQFRHVTPGTNTGNGTIENPAGDIQTAMNIAQPEDIVYVEFSPGVESPGFSIRDHVSVLSTGVTQNIATTEVGNVQLPKSGSGNLPVIQGTVNMGNNTTLAGFALVNAPTNGINAAAVSNVTIRDNRITNPVGFGISLSGVEGTNFISNNTIDNSGNGGILLQGFNNQVQQFNLDSNSVVNSNGQGIFTQASGSSNQTLNLSNNTTINNRGAGIFLQANDTSRQNINLLNGTIQDTRKDANGDGAQGIFAAANGNAQQKFTATNTTIHNNQGQGLFTAANSGAQQQINLNNLSLDRNIGQGIFAQANGNNTRQRVEINQTQSNNTNRDNNGDGGQGIFAAANSGANQELIINNSTTTDNNGQGIFIATNDDANQIVNLTGINSLNSLGQGIFVQANGRANQQVNINQTNINNTHRDNNGNGGQGLFISTNTAAQQQVNLNQINANDNAAQGIFISSSGEANTSPTQQTVNLQNSTINRNNGQGIFVQANNNVQQIVGINQNQITNTQLNNGDGGQGIFIQANGTANQQVNLTNNQITNSQGQGIFIQSNTNAQTRANIRENRVSGSTNNDIFIQANGNSQLSAIAELNQLENQLITALSANQNSNQTMCVDLRGNRTTTGFGLQRNNGTFRVPNRDNLNSTNTGTVNFQPNRDSFTDAQCQ